MFFASSTLASTGGGGISSSPKRVVDQAYEAGKSIYTGRNEVYGKLKFCINDTASAEKAKVTRKTLKAYKGTNIQEFAANLYNCDAPEQQIYKQLDSEDMNLVLYYLNKRYKLKLEN